MGLPSHQPQHSIYTALVLNFIKINISYTNSIKNPHIAARNILNVRGLAHILCVKSYMCSVGVFEVLQQRTLQLSARQADKVEPSRILDYVALCLSSIVVNKHTCNVIMDVCID